MGLQPVTDLFSFSSPHRLHLAAVVKLPPCSPRDGVCLREAASSQRPSVIVFPVVTFKIKVLNDFFFFFFVLCPVCCTRKMKHCLSRIYLFMNSSTKHYFSSSDCQGKLDMVAYMRVWICNKSHINVTTYRGNKDIYKTRHRINNQVKHLSTPKSLTNL